MIEKHLEPINKFQPAISHLLYADDIKISLPETTQNATYMAHIFNKMEGTVGLRINQAKSQLFFLVKVQCGNRK